MDRKYSSAEMRSAAFGFEADPDNCLVAVGPEVRPEDHPATIFRSYDIAAMLRQAADLQEREEKREKKYEYGVLPCGINFVYQTRAEADHKQAILEQSVGFKYPIVRREVGEWEEA